MDTLHSSSSLPTPLACRLTSTELAYRKLNVIQELKKLLIEKKEIENGFVYKFEARNEILDQLFNFIKAERQCCDFFTFRLSIGADPQFVWLELAGPSGAKAFIDQELNF